MTLHTRQLRRGLQWLIPIRANRCDHDHVQPGRIHVAQQPAQQLQKRRPLFPGVDTEQLLGLVERQHQCRRRRGRRRIQQPVARGRDRLGEPAPDLVGVGDRVLDLPEARLDQTDLLAKVMD